MLLEAKTVGWAASGRNGGFCSASLTHGIGNGLERFPDEMPLLEKLGEQNLREIGETIAKHGIDCDLQPTGELALATADWQLNGLDEEAAAAQVLLDKLQSEDSERVRLSLVTSKPLPFPPEPLRSGVIQATRASIARADRNSGQRDRWLRTLDRLGLGFES